MYFLLAILVLILILLLRQLIIAVINLVIAFQGPFFGVTTKKRLKQVIKFAQLKPGETVVDLGSGDGRVLIALAQAYPDSQVVGYEINPFLVKKSRQKIAQLGLSQQIKIYQQSFWQMDLSKFEVIVMFCTAPFMKKLEAKIKAERRDNTRVISVYFPFPHLKAKQRINEVSLY